VGGSILGKHLTFTPQRTWPAARVSTELHALMDISDGLALDLYRECSIRCRRPGRGNWRRSSARAARRRTGDTVRPGSRVSDGEGFELLIMGGENLQDDRVKLLPVGHLAQGRLGEPTLTLVHPDGRREPLEPRGYEHFK